MVTLRTLVSKPRGLDTRVEAPKPPTVFQRALATPPDAAIATIRVALGGVLFAHAAQKSLGLFGGHGFSATMQSFSESLGLPGVIAFLVIAGELCASVGLILGFLGRLAALVAAAIMTGAIVLVHWPHGFFMNWFGAQKGEGFEFHILAIAIAAAVFLRGSGAPSIDRLLTREHPSEGAPVEGPHSVESLRLPARPDAEHHS